MNRKQKLALAIRSQFRQPRGCAGWLAGREMALRSSNRQRNVWAVGLLGVEPPDRVLEIGCGPGIAIRELSRRATHGLVCGVDHSAVMVRQATRHNAEAARAGRVVLRLGSAEHLPTFAELFDKVLAVNNMGMWCEPDEGLQALHHLMRPVSLQRASRVSGRTRWRSRPRYLRARGGPVKTAVADSVLYNSVHSSLARKRVLAMETIPHDHSDSDATQEVANRGMV